MGCWAGNGPEEAWNSTCLCSLNDPTYGTLDTHRTTDRLEHHVIRELYMSRAIIEPWSMLFFLSARPWMDRVQKQNSLMYNFVEVSGHNLESSQTWGLWMVFFNHRKGGMVFYQVFLISPLQCTVNCWNCMRLREFEEIEISRQSCRGDFVWISSKNTASGGTQRESARGIG